MTSDISSGIFYKVVETNYQVVSRYNPYLGVCTLHHRRMLRVVPQKYFVTWLIRASSSNVAYKEVRKQLLHELTEKTLFIPRPKKGYVALGAVNWNIIFLFLSSENEKLNQAKFKNFTEVLETLSNDVPDTSVPATDDVLTQRVPSPARPAPEFAKETVENEESKLEKIEDATHPKVWAHIDSVSSSHTENPTRYMVLDSTAHPVYQMKGFVVEKQIKPNYPRANRHMPSGYYPFSMVISNGEANFLPPHSNPPMPVRDNTRAMEVEMWRQRVDKQEEIQLEQIKQLEWTKQMYERV